MSIVVGIVLVMAGACIGVGIMAMFALKGRDDRAEEVAEALRALGHQLDVVYICASDAPWELAAGHADEARRLLDLAAEKSLDAVTMVRQLSDLLGYSRSIFTAWTSDTDVAPVASTGIGGTASDAAAVASPMNGIGVAGSGCPVKQSIASK